MKCLYNFCILLAFLHGTDASSVRQRRDLSCFDDGWKSYLGLIPHPTNCHFYAECQLLSNDFPFPFAILKNNCMLRGKKFDFMSCTCKEPGEATCFNPYNPSHVKERMRCAEPLKEE